MKSGSALSQYKPKQPEDPYPVSILSNNLAYKLKDDETWSTEFPGYVVQKDGRNKRVRPQRQGDRLILQSRLYVRNRCWTCGKPRLTQYGTEKSGITHAPKSAAPSTRQTAVREQPPTPELLATIEGWVRTRLSGSPTISGRCVELSF